MIFHDMYVALKTVFNELYVQGIVKNKKAGKMAKNALIMAILLGSSVGGFYLYQYYTHNKEATAQKVLSECLVEYDKAAGGTGSWYDVEVAFEMGYEQNSGSKLAPYFLAYKADVMYEQGKKKEAIESFEKAIAKMSPKDDLYGIYNLKFALMKLDSDTLRDASKDAPQGDREQVQKEGLKLLEEVAQSENSGKAGALYNLGVYYWDNNDTEKAKVYFRQLVAMEIKKDGDIPAFKSSYIDIAKEKLEQLG